MDHRARRSAVTVCAMWCLPAVVMALSGTSAVAAEPGDAVYVTPPTVAPEAADVQTAVTALPPIRYAGMIGGDELLDRIRSSPRFVRLSRDLPGSPLMLRVTHSFEVTAGGKAAGFASALLAGGSLGLLPVVTNHDVAITYELLVNGVPLSSWTFRRNITRTQNIYSTDTTYGLGQEGLAWALATADEFLSAASADPRLVALVEEYAYYFGDGLAGARGERAAAPAAPGPADG